MFGFAVGPCYWVNMPTDAELLRRYADANDEDAFRELVQRQVNLVYSVALRQVGGDAHLAQDVGQRVFTDLARKARVLSDRATLGGWLYRSTHFAASDVVRAERARHAREQEAQAMNELSDDPALRADWDKLRPVLDEAIGELGERERDAVVLRFLEARPFAEIGAALRVSEDAARMRVERALEKLRAALTRRGVTSTTAALGLALANQAGATAPAGLAASLSSAALAGAGGGGGGALLIFFTMSKIKTGIVAVVALAGLATVVVEARANRELRAELGALRNGGGDIDGLQRENRQLNAALAKASPDNPETKQLTQARNRLAALRARPEGVVEAEIRPPQNRGRATPKAAMETFCWAVEQGDLDLVGSFISWSEDTKENREAFMANFSEAVRARYRTPERLGAAAFFSVGAPNPDPAVGVQILSVTEDHGPDQVKIKIWGRNASGGEWGGGDTYVRTPDGWTSKPQSLTKASIIEFALARLDPATGDVRATKK